MDPNSLVRPHLTVLSQEQIERTHAYALQILSTVGVRVDSPAARDIFASTKGARLVNSDRVLVEHPSYPNALGAIARQGARPVPLPMVPGPDGTADWDLDLATAAVRDAAPKLVNLIPDFQNPTGAVLDAAGRERVVDLARRTGTPVIADETLAELWFEEPPPAPVW